jgi:uncharacterized protein YggE
MRLPDRILLPLLIAPLLTLAGSLPPAAGADVQLRCEGTLLEARGNAELERPTRRLAVALGLEAQGADADAALAQLQQRLAAVRSSLQELAVEDLRVTSPSTWQRPAERGRPAGVTASLQVSGRLEPGRLQPLIRQVGALSGVTLGPVTSQADRAGDLEARRRLLQGAYRDAHLQAQDMAAVIGRQRLSPLEVQVEGGDLRPVAMRAMADAAPPPFDAGELPVPKDRITLLVRFCAR